MNFIDITALFIFFTVLVTVSVFPGKYMMKVFTGTKTFMSPGVIQNFHSYITAETLEGKETRIGVFWSAAWSQSTTVTSSGSVNSMHDTYMSVALRGVKYSVTSVSALLRRNLLIYGLGGIILPFIGIKLIDLLIKVI